MSEGAWAKTCALERQTQHSFNLMNLKNKDKTSFNRCDMKPTEKATFAGGCFWCVEARFDKVKGVREAISGFAGGTQANPSYEEVSQGKTNHVEAVQITFNPEEVSYKELLDIYFSSIDPTDAKGQFVDRGATYRPLIFYHDETQKKSAEESKNQLSKSGLFEKPIVVQIIPYTTFFKAEEYHQDYYKKNPLRYYLYNKRSGRVDFLKQKWKDKKPKELIKNPQAKASHLTQPKSLSPWKVSFSVMEQRKQNLTPLQYKVTQEDGTEPAFNNKYWNNKTQGIYVDIVSGEPLFSSKDKYDSKTGWPSFTRPLVPAHIKTQIDNTLLTKRTEVRSSLADSHLGHLFLDGPAPTGLRYCINSASLRFIPLEKLKEEGYGEFQSLFNQYE